MVKDCNKEYTYTCYKEYIDVYPFELDSFQKYALHAILEEKHSLVTAHTGSGKTLPAEFAIQYFCGKRKRKVIYTSPIKSLSNQKFYDFTKSFGDLSIGICTGDIKYNTDADCIIMTTEILRNYLIHPRDKNKVDFDMDIDELSCIIFDEVHYINDSSRGHIWEECMMLMPKHIQMVMLSATIANTHSFASWIETITKREVWISGSTHRVVPLEHFGYIKTFPLRNDNKRLESLREKLDGKLIPLKNKDTLYHQKNSTNIEKMKYALSQDHIRVPNSFVLNEVVQFLKQSNKLPAICFVFSRQKVETYAQCIQYNLFSEEESKKTATIEKECYHIVSNKLPNYKEYIQSNEYQMMLSLLKKGIAIHHSGIVPILKEMVELLFEKGYIKLLFATETFAVGINMPTKTVLFTSLEKFDGLERRPLLSSEYTQMAGRAGRRGLDTIGYVIHLNNMFTLEDHGIYKNIISGSNLELRSKFYLHYTLFLKLVQTMNLQQEEFLKSSLQYNESKIEIKNIEEDIDELKKQLPEESPEFITFEKIDDLEERLKLTKKKKDREKIQHTIQECKLSIHDYEKKYDQYSSYYHIHNRIQRNKGMKSDIYNREMNYLLTVTDYMIQCGCISNKNSMGIVEITEKGSYASRLHELHPLMFADLILNRDFTMFSVKEVVGILSCFSDIRVNDEVAVYDYTGNKNIERILDRMKMISDYYYGKELKCLGYVEEDDYYYHYDLIDYMMEWCDVDDENKARDILTRLNEEKGIFTGDFIKAILKINACAKELEEVCGDNHIQLQYICSEIPKYTLKYIALNQSLYI